MATERRSKWSGGKSLKTRDDKKDDRWKPPDGSRISYIRQGVVKMYVPKQGKNRVRFIEPVEIVDLDFYGMEVHFHRDIGPESGDFLCASRMKYPIRACYDDVEIPSLCPVCEKQTTDLWDTDPDLAKTYYPNERVLYWVFDLLADNPKEIKLWSCPLTLSKEIIAQSNKDETDVYIPVSDPDLGTAVSYTRSGSGKMDTKYSGVQVHQEPIVLTDEELASVPRFVDCLVVATYDEVKAADDGNTPDQPVQSESSPTTDEQVHESAPEPEEPICYQKDFGKYRDCDSCEFAGPCESPPEPDPVKEEKPEKPERPSRPERPQRPSRPNRDEQKSDAVPDSSRLAEIKDRIAETKKNREEANGG